MAKRIAFLLVCLGTFLCFNFENAHAIEITTGGSSYFRACEMFFDYPPQNGVRYDIPLTNGTPTNSSYDCAMSKQFAPGQELKLTNIKLYTEGAIEANELINFDISYRLSQESSMSDTYLMFDYQGLQFGNPADGVILLNENCQDENTQQHSMRTLTCSYLALTTDRLTSIRSFAGSTILYALNSSQNTQLQVRISGFTTRRISYNGLSSNDRAWLESVLPDSTTVGEVEQAIDNARESEKDEYENQADENEQTANDNSSAAQGTATSLLSVVGQFIGVLTSAQPTNCNLNGNLVPHLPLGQLNLCQNSPPAAITILGSLLLIAFVVPLAYHTVKRMLALIGSFQS